MIEWKIVLGAAWAFALGLHATYWVFALLIVADMLMAMGAAVVTGGSLSLGKCRDGIIRKSMLVVVLVAVAAAGRVAMSTWGVDFPAGPTVAALCCGHEMISVLRHAERAGIWLPRPLREALRKGEATI